MAANCERTLMRSAQDYLKLHLLAFRLVAASRAANHVADISRFRGKMLRLALLAAATEASLCEARKLLTEIKEAREVTGTLAPNGRTPRCLSTTPRPQTAR
jgi:hypothetical protein